VQQVGVFQCKALVTDNIWHDTKGDRSKYIPLFKGRSWFWKQMRRVKRVAA
jgi:hypothetical protein